jgi:hypothetical protein
MRKQEKVLGFLCPDVNTSNIQGGQKQDIFKMKNIRERGKETERQRQTERQTDRQRDRETVTDIETHTERKIAET